MYYDNQYNYNPYSIANRTDRYIPMDELPYVRQLARRLELANYRPRRIYPYSSANVNEILLGGKEDLLRLLKGIDLQWLNQPIDPTNDDLFHRVDYMRGSEGGSSL